MTTFQPVMCLMAETAVDRRAFRLLLEHDLNLIVTVECGFAPVSIWQAVRARPSLVLVEVDCFSRERLEAVQLLKRLLPTAKTLLVSALSDPAQLKAWGCCSLTGCVAKTAGIEELRAAINAVLAGNTYFSSGTDSALRRGRQIRAQIANLSRREAELLPLLAKGCTLREAAAQLSVAYKTADSHRTNLLRKLGLHDRVDLARFAIREGLVAP